MDWLKKLPVIGPFVAGLMRTHAWRSYETLDRVHWTRLAAAITFISFLSLFPLITVGAAVGAALLSEGQLDRIQDSIEKQVPGISDQLDLNALVANAGTVGLVAGALLLFTGIGWVGSMRECLRAVWELDDGEQGNPVVLKGKDGLVLLGLGAVGLASLAASGLGSTAVGWTAARLGIPEGGAGGVLLQAAALAVAVLADFLLLLYVLTLLPRVQPPRRRLVVAALLGAVGFELLKLLLGGYMKGVAGKSMYGAFGVPVALLLWINFTAKLLLFCAAWTATRGRTEAERADAQERADGPERVTDGPERVTDGPERVTDGPERVTDADGDGPDRAAASAG
ncbi:YihY/virulence factor BrkB family protein [Streptomyces corynorhini]|uniref:YihY/virulence factor BrkB family protein n=1 Tax=Streptomyces corynorhini TaxID=2282652 RepID=A0A370B061_9ACTN|nr:YihY/virulence factor BrkB family protein [Streptomyces corynorhini]RDG35307.1 YihY/virulence factor BrkB family protein [Streptomyces corynorhini]